jgi:hypothetical protein
MANSAEGRLVQVTAAPDSALTCFGYQNRDPRVYYLDAGHTVNELAWLSGIGWQNTPLPGVAAAGSALTCYGVNDTDPRVYYLDAENRVNELESSAYGEWKNNLLPGTAGPGSALTCFGVDEVAGRVYYLDANHAVHELAFAHNRWTPNPLGVKAVAGSDLACYGADGEHTRLYYSGTSDRVSELAWENGAWKSPSLIPGIATAGTRLACFPTSNPLPTVLLFVGIDQQITHVYYSDVTKSYTCDILPFTADPASPLTCLGTETEEPRLYYLDPSGQLIEFAYWGNDLSDSNPSGLDTASGYDARPQAAGPAPGTALTCFPSYGSDPNGPSPRVYYLDADHHVSELAWITSAQSAVVQATAAPADRT